MGKHETLCSENGIPPLGVTIAFCFIPGRRCVSTPECSHPNKVGFMGWIKGYGEKLFHLHGRG